MRDEARAKILAMIAELESISLELEDLKDNEIAKEIETAIEALKNATEIITE
jgi:hypothetical protein